jgi:SanA protein
VVGIATFGVPTFYASANARIINHAKGSTFKNLAEIPHHRVGIVLGCSPKTGSHPNPFFVGRINAAVALYNAGKVDRLLVTGDNGRQNYDEPTAMKEALVAQGIPALHISMDFAGFKTLDSMVRARKVFGLTDATIITDDFHIARSLYFAEGAGIQAVGYPSVAAQNRFTGSIEFREVLARGLAVIDRDVLHSKPKFLGKRETIP